MDMDKYGKTTCNDLNLNYGDVIYIDHPKEEFKGFYIVEDTGGGLKVCQVDVYLGVGEKGYTNIGDVTSLTGANAYKIIFENYDFISELKKLENKDKQGEEIVGDFLEDKGIRIAEFIDKLRKEVVV